VSTMQDSNTWILCFLNLCLLDSVHVLLVPPKVSLQKYVFLEYAFILCICFFVCVCQWSINWLVSCHVKYLQLVSRVKDVGTILCLC